MEKREMADDNGRDEMTKEQAIAYCRKHENEFKSEMFASGEDGVEQFGCLVSCLESGHIKPTELADYGMDFG
jgi:hypothetical protein